MTIYEGGNSVFVIIYLITRLVIFQHVYTSALSEVSGSEERLLLSVSLLIAEINRTSHSIPF